MCMWYMYALRIESTSESNPRSYEATKAVAKKAQKTSEGSMGCKPMTSVIPVQCSTNWAMKPRCEQIKRQFNLYSLYEDVFLVVSKVKCKSFWYTVFCMSNPLQYLNSILANKTFSSGSCHFGMDLLFHYHVFLSKLNMKIARTWRLLSNNVNTTIRKYSSRAFIWVVTPLGFLGQFRI